MKNNFIKSAVFLLAPLFFVFITTADSAFAAAPVLDATRTPAMNTMAENAGVPSGAVGTVVSNLVDSSIPAGGVDNIVGAGGTLGVAVIAVNSNFACYYTVNSGAAWSLVGSVSPSSARLLAADSNTRIYCRPNTDVSGSFTNVITMRAWDQSSGTNGGTGDSTVNGGATAFSVVTDIVSMTVTGVNELPGATNMSAAETYTEETSLNLIDIVVSDIDQNPVTATLTLSSSTAGTLSTSTSGIVTSTFNTGTGVWTASGDIPDVNNLLAGLIFNPARNFSSDFTIATRVSDGTASTTGTKAMTGIDTPEDTDAPDTFILSASSDSVESAAIEIEFASNEEDTAFECKIDDGSFAACTSPYESPELAAGPHAFYVRAIDEAENVDASPATFTWTIYADVPDVIEKFPAEEATDVEINTPIIFTFDAPVSEELQSHIITEGLLCTDICPTFETEWSKGDTVVTYTAQEDYSPNANYSIGLRLEDNTLAELSYVLFTTGEDRIESRRRTGSRTRNAVVTAPPTQAPSAISSSTSVFIFTRDLTIGLTGEDVKELQKFLNKNGFVLAGSGPGSNGNETDMFGGLTRAALIKYQISKGIVPAIGYFGPITRGVVNQL